MRRPQLCVGQLPPAQKFNVCTVWTGVLELDVLYLVARSADLHQIIVCVDNQADFGVVRPSRAVAGWRTAPKLLTQTIALRCSSRCSQYGCAHRSNGAPPQARPEDSDREGRLACIGVFRLFKCQYTSDARTMYRCSWRHRRSDHVLAHLPTSCRRQLRIVAIYA